MFWWLLKFDSKLILKKTKQSLSFNKVKNDLLTFLNQKVTLSCIFLQQIAFYFKNEKRLKYLII